MEKPTQSFHNNKIPREGCQFNCLSVTLVNSVLTTGKNYYPQVFLEECKYFVKGKEIPKYIIDNIENSSDSDRGNSDEENFDGENSNKENYNKKNSHEENPDEKNEKVFLKLFYLCIQMCIKIMCKKFIKMYV